jgi:hypothetical protein
VIVGARVRSYLSSPGLVGNDLSFGTQSRSGVGLESIMQQRHRYKAAQHSVVMNSHRLTRFRWEFIRWGGTACCAGRVQPTALLGRFSTLCYVDRRLGLQCGPHWAAADARRWAALDICHPHFRTRFAVMLTRTSSPASCVIIEHRVESEGISPDVISYASAFYAVYCYYHSRCARGYTVF